MIKITKKVKQLANALWMAQVACYKFANGVLYENISIYLNIGLGTICKSVDI